MEAIQKPIVSAIDALARKVESLLRVLEKITELRFFVETGQQPWSVRFIAMVDDGAGLEVEEEAQLGGWLEDLLVGKGGGGPIKEIALAFRTQSEISLRDYLATTHLPLDRFSPEDEPRPAASEAAEG